MRLTEIYLKEISLKELFTELEKEFQLDENIDPGLSDLLQEADELVFKKFNINPSEKKYFIAGSARLYLYSELREAFNLPGNIGDLDLVIPDKKLWVDAGLTKELEAGGIYRPTADGSVEAFTVWDPSKAGGEYADVKVRSTNEILQGATLVNGYYFMSFLDVVDYKTSLNRDKEKEVVDLILKYKKGSFKDKREFLRQILNTIGEDKYKELFAMGK